MYRYFMFGIFVGVTIMLIPFSIYNMVYNQHALYLDRGMLENAEKKISDLMPPSHEVVESRISQFTDIEKAFVYLDFAGSYTLFSNKWVPQKPSESFINTFERKALKAFQKAGIGYNEYNALLTLKYGLSSTVPCQPISPDSDSQSGE